MAEGGPTCAQTPAREARGTLVLGIALQVQEPTDARALSWGPRPCCLLRKPGRARSHARWTGRFPSSRVRGQPVASERVWLRVS